MAIQEIHDILAADGGVTALVGQRISPITNAQDTPLPFITLQRVSLSPANHLTGHGYMDANRVQVDSCALSFVDVTTLANAVRAAMDAADVLMLSQVDLFEDQQAPGFYRISQDYLYWTS